MKFPTGTASLISIWIRCDGVLKFGDDSPMHRDRRAGKAFRYMVSGVLATLPRLLQSAYAESGA
jgi:hypothetical protein